MSEIKVAKKRGRKSNAEKKLLLEKANINNDEIANVPKKRGRKPKGGKIIENNNTIETNKDIAPNIILHLKCNNNDIQTFDNTNNIESFNILNNNKNTELSYLLLNDNNKVNNDNNTILSQNITNNKSTNNNQLHPNDNNDKEIYQKLKELQNNLHTNNISDKKSHAFGALMNLIILLYIYLSL